MTGFGIFGKQWGGASRINKILFEALPEYHNSNLFAYAASFGKSLPGNPNYLKYQDYLASCWRKYKIITLREPDWLDTLNALNLPCAPVTTALDPAFLLDADAYTAFTSVPMVKEPYILLYIFGLHYGAREARLLQVLDVIDNFRRASGMSNLAVLDISPGPLLASPALIDKFKSMKLRYEWRFATSPSEFINFCAHSSLNLTNSFHCAVYSLIFSRRFMYSYLHQADPRVRLLEKHFAMDALQLNPKLAGDLPLLQECTDFVQQNFEEHIDALRRSSYEVLEKILTYKTRI